jgi:Zn-dependent protease with chaperone function
VTAAAARLLLVVATLSACASAPRSQPVRAPTEAELRTVEQALVPLLPLLDPPLKLDCPLGLGVIRSTSINAGVAMARPGSGCPTFSLLVTDGALQRLPLDMLRAVLAHELGHVRLGHLEARRERGTTASVRGPFSAAFDRRQEAEADRFAVQLLRRLEGERPDACVALVYVFSVLAEQPAGAGWLAAHPSPDRRAETVMAGCNGQ